MSADFQCMSEEILNEDHSDEINKIIKNPAQKKMSKSEDFLIKVPFKS
jgi:hypothetical protein